MKLLVVLFSIVSASLANPLFLQPPSISVAQVKLLSNLESAATNLTASGVNLVAGVVGTVGAVLNSTGTIVGGLAGPANAAAINSAINAATNAGQALVAKAGNIGDAAVKSTTQFALKLANDLNTTGLDQQAAADIVTYATSDILNAVDNIINVIAQNATQSATLVNLVNAAARNVVTEVATVIAKALEEIGVAANTAATIVADVETIVLNAAQSILTAAANSAQTELANANTIATAANATATANVTVSIPSVG